MQQPGDAIKRLFDRRATRKPQVEQSVYSVEHELLSEFIYSDMRERADRFRTSVDDAPMVPGATPDVEVPYEAISDLGGDVFMAHVDSADEVGLKDRQEIKKSRELHRAIMEQYLANDDYRKAHLMTRNDPVGSALSTMAAMNEVKESLRTTLKDHAERAEKMREAEEEIEQIESQLPPPPPPPPDTPPGPEGFPGGPGGDQPGAGEGEPGYGTPVPGEPDPNAPIDPNATGPSSQTDQLGGLTPEQFEELVNGLDQAEQKLDALADEQAQSGMGVAVAEALDKAAEQAKDVADGYMSLPGVGGGQPPQMPPDKMIEFAEKWLNNPTMRRVSKIIGRIERDMASAAARNIETEEGTPLDVELGNNLRKVLAHEIINLVSDDEARELLFYRKFATAQLMQWQMFEDEDAGMGDAVFAMDVSGSMSGRKNEWARAVALATGSLMAKTGRGFGIVEFNSYVVKEFYFPRGRRLDLEQMVEFAGRGVSGGTDITDGVRRAFEIIQERSGEFKKADIVLVTDGSDSWGHDDDVLRKELTEAGIRVHCVTIGMRETAYTNKMGDTAIAAFDLMNPSDATRKIAQGITA